MASQDKYPALMAYIEDRNSAELTPEIWTAQLRIDEVAAYNGSFAEVAIDLIRAHDDYQAEQRAKGLSSYPYNHTVGEFLGLPVRENNEPPIGYYMASRVMRQFRLGRAEREIRSILANDKIVSALLRRDATIQDFRFASIGSDQTRFIWTAGTWYATTVASGLHSRRINRLRPPMRRLMKPSATVTTITTTH